MLASKGDRLANFIFDTIIIGIITLIFSITLALIFYLSYMDILIFIYIPVHIVYYIFFEYRFGQTPGKRFSKTRVVRKDGNPPTLLNIFSRTVMRFIKIDPASFTYGTGIGFHDVMSNTLVIKE